MAEGENVNGEHYSHNREQFYSLRYAQVSFLFVLADQTMRVDKMAAYSEQRGTSEVKILQLHDYHLISKTRERRPM
jgi:hypothetical protein